LVTAFSGRGDYRGVRMKPKGVLAKLTEVESNAWPLFNELPPCGAACGRGRAYSVGPG
jgi:hypothetical protein